MRRERRKPTRAEWARITSSRPVVRRIRPPQTRHGREKEETIDRCTDESGRGVR
jgi:hypothetical protein